MYDLTLQTYFHNENLTTKEHWGIRDVKLKFFSFFYVTTNFSLTKKYCTFMLSYKIQLCNIKN